MPAKKKGAKLSKAEKARLKKEEDERKLQEEEEARIKAERDEEERLEREKRDQEELQRLELKDRERREDELTEVRLLLEEIQAGLMKWNAQALEKAKWERYLRCDGNPDPSDIKEMNTYISLWREDLEVNINPVLKQCALALQLTDELKELLSNSRDNLLALRYQEHLLCLYELIREKVQRASVEILKNAIVHCDIGTGNMHTVIKDDNITLCIWANLNKNPRFTGFHFKEAALGFELPKQLAMSDITVRILHTAYDHLTPRSLSPKARSFWEGGLSPGTEPPAEGEGGERGGDGGAEEVKEGEAQGEEKGQSVHGRRRSAASVRSNNDKVVEEPESEVRTEGSGGGVPAEAAPPSDGAQEVDLQQYTLLGGVFFCDIFRLPPQISKVGGWEIQQLLDSGLQVFPYPPESRALGSPPVGLSVILPKTVLCIESPQIAYWDATRNCWRTNGVRDVCYDAEEARVSFKMESFQAFALLQHTYSNLPLQGWELRPLDQDQALFTVRGALVDLTITIKDDQCMLQSEQPRFPPHLMGKWMHCSALQAAMANAGINIFVNEHTDKYVNSGGKDAPTEHALYQQMAILAPAYAFSWSQWNAKCGAECMVMQVCEHHHPYPVPSGQWSLYLLGAQRSQQLKMEETSATFSSELETDTEFHSTFIHMVRDRTSPEGAARSKGTSFLFVQTVQTLLSATRPLNYS